MYLWFPHLLPFCDFFPHFPYPSSRYILLDTGPLAMCSDLSSNLNTVIFKIQFLSHTKHVLRALQQVANNDCIEQYRYTFSSLQRVLKHNAGLNSRGFAIPSLDGVLSTQAMPSQVLPHISLPYTPFALISSLSLPTVPRRKHYSVMPSQSSFLSNQSVLRQSAVAQNQCVLSPQYTFVLTFYISDLKWIFTRKASENIMYLHKEVTVKVAVLSTMVAWKLWGTNLRTQEP